MKRFTAALVTALLASACTAGTASTAPFEADTISYETGMCYGTCPVYKVTVRADGSGTFEGRDFTAVRGTREFRVTPEQFRALADHLAPLRPRQGSVRIDGDTCSNHVTDNPSGEAIWSNQSGAKQSYFLDFGCDRERSQTTAERLQAVPGMLPIGDLIGPR